MSNESYQSNFNGDAEIRELEPIVEDAIAIDNPSTGPLRELSRTRITIFEDRDFRGDSLTLDDQGFSYVGTDWNDKITSIIIESGAFVFYGAANYGTEDWGPVRLEVGRYPFVGDVGIRNDSISSFKAFYYGPAPVPPPTPPLPPPPPSPPAPPKQAKDYIRLTRNNLVLGSVCAARGEDRLINDHPTRTILVNYHRDNSPVQYSQTVLPRNESGVGCSFGTDYHLDDSTQFL